MSKLVFVTNPMEPAADIVFVHGLGGSAADTWRSSNDTYWPDLLASESEALRIAVLDYDASPAAWFSPAMPLTDRATNVLARLAADGIGQRPLCFICHSMGGLLVKKLLHHAFTLAPDYAQIATATRAVAFLATPHGGSDLATLVDFLKLLTRNTIAVQELQAQAPQLRELNLWYRNNAGIRGIVHRVFFESHKIVGTTKVVDAGSADPGLQGVTPVAIDADHFSICKPADRTAIVHREVFRLFQDVLQLQQSLSESQKSKVHTSSASPSLHRATHSHLDRYQTVATVYKGAYSLVRKCVRRDTGERCILKETEVSYVSLEAMEKLKSLRCSGIASPIEVWQHGDKLFEELPYVGGVRLSEMLVPGVGCMGGRVLEVFYYQMRTILGELHREGIIHRDIHPDNIYVVAEPISEDSVPKRLTEQHDHSDIIGHSNTATLLRIILVDHTFAVLEGEADTKLPVVHGAYTPEEQAKGRPTIFSDLYAFGATIYYAIGGVPIPPFVERRLRGGPTDFPNGNSACDFSSLLHKLLALNENRRLDSLELQAEVSWVPRHSGVLKLSDSKLLITDSRMGPLILSNSDALEYLQHLRHFEAEQPDVLYWLKELTTRQE